MASFIHLRVHSAYSMLEGAIPVKAMPGLCERRAMPALAITDSGNLFGALEFSETMAGAGIQPIIGCLLPLAYAPPAPGDDLPPVAPLLLLAQSQTGYDNLMKLGSAAFLEAPGGAPHVTMAALGAASEGLICLSGGPNGPAGRLIRRNRRGDAIGHLEALEAIFPDRLYIELHRHGTGGRRRTPAEAETEPVFLDHAYDRTLPIVATNDVLFDTPDMHEAHDAMLCIAGGRYVSEEDRPRVTPEHHFKSAEAMAERFDDLPEAIEATVEIAQRCAFRPRTAAPILPRFADDEVEELRAQARAGLARRIEAAGDLPVPREDYEKRLDYELGVIERMGFPGYFLIVADFIQWAKGQEIPVGPGRGSGAGSVVAWALTITDLDPIRYGLLFERFLNPERVSMPDFDIDFCQDRRDEVIRYVQGRYGRDRVAQIITFGKLQARAALRDVGRVLQMPYGQVDKLCKMVPNNPANPVTLQEAIESEPRLQEARRDDETVARMLDIATRIEGLYRHASTHAAGVVIGDRPLDALVPLYRDPRSDMPATQFNMKWVEPAGLVKFDFLGLKTLTVLQNAIDLLRARGVEVDLARIPLDDEDTYALYSRADTVGVFQVEGSGMRDALRQLKPTCIEDIIALVALYRPGPMDNIPRYCAVKNGREAAEYVHPGLEPLLRETHGIIIYQEQVMEIARVLSGYSLGEADLLRRAMGKKIRAEMDKQRARFVDGAVERGLTPGKATEIFELLAKFANYGFNKSHAAAYALVSYQTAWMKATYPVEFMAALMNLDTHNTDKLAIYKQELDRAGISIAPPCVNRSGAAFTVEDGRILYALGALKNIGHEAMAAVERTRREGGPFTDIFDFLTRIDPRLINRRAMEVLIRAGAFDALDANRRRLFDSLDRLMAYAEEAHGERPEALGDLLGGVASAEAARPRLADCDDWPPAERLAGEQTAAGFYLSGHPLDAYGPVLRQKGFLTYAELEAKTGVTPVTARLAAAVMGRQERRSQRGTRFAFVQLSDTTGVFEATVFSDTLADHRDSLEAGALLALSVEAGREGEQLKIRVQGVEPLAGAAVVQGDLRIHVTDRSALSRVRDHLGPPVNGRGAGRVALVLRVNEPAAEVEVALPGRYAVGMEARGAIKEARGVLHLEEVRSG